MTNTTSKEKGEGLVAMIKQIIDENLQVFVNVEHRSNGDAQVEVELAWDGEVFDCDDGVVEVSQ